MPTVSKNGVGATPVTNFSEEKKQKTFAIWGSELRQLRGHVAKVFWFFFSKKNGFATPICAQEYISSTPGAARDFVGRYGFDQAEGKLAGHIALPQAHQVRRRPLR
jgi:hypothetical protein